MSKRIAMFAKENMDEREDACFFTCDERVNEWRDANHCPAEVRRL